ncbi:glycosyltransferase WbsX family protein [Pararcticibacter amylolyticus]|uniref:Glycosyl hydrolase n=1 Tax=Pararcticibacter amylolyticus TaxID=2173175 RepID=A0A2U2PIS4_9SPHI|nr:glycoside hydrolase family 99-like domain-containing protein [Pararcticibacter amylolyticus]PWG81059.1 glycosyl hydrolase [Pararcticibacter amylolyticus]
MKETVENHSIKAIAIYLPQFHPIPENDMWWGKGFTEWTNVTRSKPKFKGHYQPHLPADLGFYDLRLLETHIDQANLAKQYGIHGFCYYHYWFNGKLLLEQPLHLVLKNKEIDMPFCLCWANENWTRRWDGFDNQVLQPQQYSIEDDKEHIQYLINFFQDERYIKIDGKPVFLMYRSESHPDINTAVDIWREQAKLAGFPDLFLIRVENFEKNIDPKLHGFDAGLEFAPDFFDLGSSATYINPTKDKLEKFLHKKKIVRNEYFDNTVYLYSALMETTLAKEERTYKYFRSVCPSWDNSARRQSGATIYKDSTPELFETWLKIAAQMTVSTFRESERFIFINAWNEWGEGCHLEPDQKWGHAYLQAVKNVLNS